MCTIIIAGLNVSIIGLERALHNYTLDPTEDAFDMKTVPLETTPLAEQKAPEALPSAAKQADKVVASTQEIYAGK